MPYLIGNAVTLSTTITNSSNVAVDPATITLVITKPDNTTDTFTGGQLTHSGTGQYSYVYLPATAGTYLYVWTATGPNAANDGTFLVVPATSTLITPADVRAHINDPNLPDDNELEGFIAAAGQIVQFDPDYGVGPITPTTYTESHNGGDCTIYVRRPPILSVTSIMEYYGSQAWTLSLQPYGSSVDAYGYSIDDPYAGRIVRRTLNGSVYMFPPGIGNIVITYVAGQSSIPANVRNALLELVRHMYQTQQGGRNVRSIDDLGPGFMIPNRVIEALRPSKRPPVVG